MTQKMRELSRLLADLLEYPVAHPAQVRDKVQHAAARFDDAADADTRSALNAVADYLSSASLGLFQGTYLEVFDEEDGLSLLPATVYGEDAAGGLHVTAELENLYRESGFAAGGMNPPDYLPQILEYLSLAPQSGINAVLGHFGDGIRTLAQALADREAPYAHIGGCLAALVDACAPAVLDAKER